MTRDRVSVDEINHDLSQSEDYQKTKEELIDECNSGETDWVADLSGDAAKELLAEIAGFVYLPSIKVADMEMIKLLFPDKVHEHVQNVRLSEIRERCRGHIEAWAELEAGKRVEAPY